MDHQDLKLKFFLRPFSGFLLILSFFHFSCSPKETDYYVSVKNIAPPMPTPSAPTINRFDPPSNNIYRATQSLDFTIQFSEPVNIYNTPSLELRIGGILKSANYFSGDGTDTITFRYSPSAPDFDIDGIEILGYLGSLQDIKSVTTNLNAIITLPLSDTSLVWIKTTPTSGLVAHWGFNETPNSTTALNSVTNDPLVLTNFQSNYWFSQSRFLGGLSFISGSSTWARTTSYSLIGKNNYSFSLWFRPNSLTSNDIQAIFWQGTPSDNGFGLNSSTRELGLFMNSYLPSCPSKINFYLGYNNPITNTTTCTDEPNNVYITDTTTNITNNFWIHAVVTVSGATEALVTSQMYINGLLIGSQTGIETNQTGMNPTLYFGRTGLNNVRMYNGDLDEIRIYDRVLTPLEVNHLYQE